MCRIIIFGMVWKPLKIIVVLLLMWLASIAAIFRELERSRVFTSEEKKFNLGLDRFREKFRSGHTFTNLSIPPFDVWKLIPTPSLNYESKLSALQQDDRIAPGENGNAVSLAEGLPSTVRRIVSKGWDTHAFNEFVSDVIPVNRTLPDVRDEWCKVQNYSENLPQVSVIICFYNEAWSTLIRTVTSVLLRSPEHLIKEIIIFDDFSNLHHLKIQLEDFIKTIPKVKLVRSEQRQGLIRSRMIAFKHAQAPVVLFLDSHCECTKGWLEPILDRIVRNRKTIVSPVVDIIDYNTFEYIAQDVHDLRIGTFTWDLRFTWSPIPEDIQSRRNIAAAPIKTPIISGGLFAVDKSYFEELGLYDEGLETWGMENIELSFKTWMCGGSMEVVPCSHVGHVFRKWMPYAAKAGTYRRNAMRVAEVWMDDYAKYFRERAGDMDIEFGDVTKQKELRQKLNCKSFEWYLQNVCPNVEMPDSYVASGKIYSKQSEELCLDAMTKESVNENLKIQPCHYKGFNQFFAYTRAGLIKHNHWCLDYILRYVVLFICRPHAATQVWLYDDNTKLIINMKEKKCLRVVKANQQWELHMDECTQSRYHQWSMDKYDVKKLAPDLKEFAMKNYTGFL